MARKPQGAAPRRAPRKRKASGSSEAERQIRIMVLGIGGAGNRTVAKLLERNTKTFDCVAVNTDLHDLNGIDATRKVLIGEHVTCGLSANGNPEVGRRAAEESRAHLETLFENVNIAFLVAGLGGGTGTGAAPVVADVARRKVAIVVGIVTMPLREETGKVERAMLALNQMANFCDTIVVVDNNKFLEFIPSLPAKEAFGMANQTLANIIEGMVESVSTTNLINLGFADFRSAVKNGGIAVVGVGKSNASNRAEEAVRYALKTPLLDADCAVAKGALIHVSGRPAMTVEEASKVGRLVSDAIGHDAMVSWGADVGSSVEDGLKVTVVMTGMPSTGILSGLGNFGSKLFNIESSYSGPEKPLPIDLDLDQIENFED